MPDLYVTNTVGNLCTEALALLNVVDDEASVPAEEMNRAAKQLQLMLKSWAAQDVQIWMRRESSAINTVDGTANYDLSSNSLTSAEVVAIYITDSGENVRTPLKAISRADYFALSDRTTEGKPTHYWPQFTATDQDITLWPTPDGVYDIYLDYRLDFTDQDERTDAIEVPGYWMEAIAWCLAERLIVPYGKSGTPLAAEIHARAADLYANASVMDIRADGGGVVSFVPDWR